MLVLQDILNECVVLLISKTVLGYHVSVLYVNRSSLYRVMRNMCLVLYFFNLFLAAVKSFLSDLHCALCHGMLMLMLGFV